MSIVKERIVLTVSEGKRLIAKGVAASLWVKRALDEGMIVIAKGSTNGYIVEELLGQRIDKLRYALGLRWPQGRRRRLPPGERLPDVVLRRGEAVEGMDLDAAVQEMGPGDVFIKGANALNYQAGLAGVLAGPTTGGTIGRNLMAVLSRRATLLIPVGLEKEIAWDIAEVARATRAPDVPQNILVSVEGEIITEIEALRLLTGVEAVQVAAGGIGGAEGAIELLVEGNEEAMAATRRLLEGVWGEPPFVEERE